MHYTDLTRSGNTIMYMEIIEIYLLFNRSCTINGLKPRVCVCVCVGGGGYPIFDIIVMGVPNSPPFQRP